MLLFLAFAALASVHAVFPLFPLLPLVLFLVAARTVRLAGAWRKASEEADPQRALPDGIGKEKELLKALERAGEVTAARAALETSLSVAQAEEMLSALANDGHVRVVASGGTLAYALWE